jgi:hypothetical protein
MSLKHLDEEKYPLKAYSHGYNCIMVYWYNGSSYLVWEKSIRLQFWYNVSWFLSKFQEKQGPIFPLYNIPFCVIP